MKDILWTLFKGIATQNANSEPLLTQTFTTSGVVIVMTGLSGGGLVTPQLLSRVSSLIPELKGFFCMSLLPFPIFMAKTTECPDQAIRDGIARLVSCPETRCVITFGELELGSFGSNALVTFGCIGKPVIIGVRVILTADGNSSWCDATIAKALGVTTGATRQMEGDSFVEICPSSIR